MATLADFVDAYENYEGKSIDSLIYWWEKYLAGIDTPCPESPDGLHQVSDGSCDMCGDKNRD